MSGLSIISTNPCAKKAIFTSKANLTDITNPALPITIYGGITLQVSMTDNDEIGLTDLIGITLLNGNNLVYSSNWVNINTVELMLKRGNIKVQNGVVCNGNNLIAGKGQTFETDEEVDVDTTTVVKAYPNPFINYSTISYTLKEAMHTSLTLYDNKGIKLMQLVNGNMTAGMHNVRVDGAKLAAGVYIYLLQTVDAKGERNTVNGKLVVQK